MSFRYRWAVVAFLVGLTISFAGLPAWSQLTFNEYEVKSTRSALDKADVWAFDFRFKLPRMIKANVPARGTRICWYMWFQIINRTDAPRNFIGNFELVTLDSPGVYLDEPLPSVLEAIRRIEDPAGVQDIKSVDQISTMKIPVSKAAGRSAIRGR